MNIKTYQLGPLATNAYLLEGDGSAVVVDPGGDPSELLARLESQGLNLTHILLTHLHFDHIYGVRALAEATGAPVLASREDTFLMDTEVGAGGMMGLPKVPEFSFEPLAPGEVQLLGLQVNVLPTPGHTPGSLSFHFPAVKAVFVGDLLFYRSVGRTDFPGGSSETLAESVKTHIFTLPPETVVYSGHGPETTVGDEMNHNPFFAGF